MEITSKPIALDEINRSVLKLEMERLSLTNDTDKASRDRLSRLEAELSLLKEKQAELTEQWEHEKTVMTRIQSIKEEVCKCSLETFLKALFPATIFCHLSCKSEDYFFECFQIFPPTNINVEADDGADLYFI